MAATIVISQILKVNGERFFVKGTVDGNAHYAVFDDLFMNPYEVSTATVAAWFGNNYYQIWTAINADFKSHTITLPVLDGKSLTVAFGASPATQIGYEYLEFTATVGGTASQKAIIRIDEFLNYVYAYGPGKVSAVEWVAMKLRECLMNESMGGYGDFTATFSVDLTSSTSTTTTTTSTTSTTSTTTTTTTTTSTTTTTTTT